MFLSRTRAFVFFDNGQIGLHLLLFIVLIFIVHLIIDCLLMATLSLTILADVPTQMPPLTPGTNKKLTEVLKASFASWEKEVQYRNITKGKLK